MAMRKSIRRELSKLRELVFVLCRHAKCCFCDEPFFPRPVRGKIVGRAKGPVLTEKICCHHRNGNHYDDRPSNIALAHRSCHARHHLLERLERDGGMVKNARRKRCRRTGKQVRYCSCRDCGKRWR